MAIATQLIRMDSQQSVSIVLPILGAVGSGLFALVSWGVKLLVSRELRKSDEAEQRFIRQQRFNERIISSFARLGVAVEYPEGD